LEFFRRVSHDVLSRFVTRPKKFRVQISAGKFLALIFWDQDGILLIFQRAKLSTQSISISTGANEGHFEGKTQREDHHGCLVLAFIYFS